MRIPLGVVFHQGLFVDMGDLPMEFGITTARDTDPVSGILQDGVLKVCDVEVRQTETLWRILHTHPRSLTIDAVTGTNDEPS